MKKEQRLLKDIIIMITAIICVYILLTICGFDTTIFKNAYAQSPPFENVDTDKTYSNMFYLDSGYNNIKGKINLPFWIFSENNNIWEIRQGNVYVLGINDNGCVTSPSNTECSSYKAGYLKDNKVYYLGTINESWIYNSNKECISNSGLDFKHSSIITSNQYDLWSTNVEYSIFALEKDQLKYNYNIEEFKTLGTNSNYLLNKIFRSSFRESDYYNYKKNLNHMIKMFNSIKTLERNKGVLRKGQFFSNQEYMRNLWKFSLVKKEKEKHLEYLYKNITYN